MVDVLNNPNLSLEQKVLDKGFVRLVDVMPRLTSKGTVDGAIVQAARVSYQGTGETTDQRDRDLIRYLMRHHHTSPFEQVEIKLHIKLPIFIARQWIRHRTANVNEVSGRYSQLKDEYYIPDFHRMKSQSATNHQGSSDEELDEDLIIQMLDLMRSRVGYAFHDYKKLLDGGLARELSRVILPLSTYTEWYWKIDLHNLLHFLKLRLDPHAQEEIRLYAEAIFNMLEEIAPVTCEAFKDYVLNSKTFSKQELQEISKLLISNDNIFYSSIEKTIPNNLERQEFYDKLNKLYEK